MKAAAKTDIPAAQRLQKKRDQLLSAFLSKGDINSFLVEHTAALDHYFIERFEQSMVGPRMNFHKKPYAMIALGGYGRQEQCLHSDIDFLLLFKKNVPRESEELIQEIIYPLWDMGFEVGHATRSVKECLRLASEDIDACTALLDARFLCGMSPLYSELRERLYQQMSGNRGQKTIAALVDGNSARHDKFGDSSYLLEPNLKDGQGGLRDYHTMLWIARITSKIVHPRDLEYNGYLSHEEFQKLEAALAFIWKIRNYLHYLSQRKSDQLFFEHQKKIAAILNFKDTRDQMAVERFLGRLHEHLEFIKQTNLMFLLENGHTRRLSFRRLTAAKPNVADGLEIKENLLGFASPEAILSSSHLLIKIFEESARLQLPLGSEAKRIVKEFLHLVDARFRRDPLNVKAFERILVTPADTFNVLNEMLKTGFLVKFIPKIKTIVNRIQYDGYHLYPIGRHSLRAVKIVKSFGTKNNTDPLTTDLYKGLGRQKTILLWATLLHDIGKGDLGEEDHSVSGARIAAAILNRMGYRPPFIETVSFLIKEHLLLAKTATRRDLSDEETAIACARRVKDAKNLKMLYLLTMADSMATGPKAWNDWTAELLRDLFLKTLKIIEKGELASQEAVAAIEQKKQAVLEATATQHERENIQAHLGILSPRYLLHTPAHEIPEHLRLFKQLGDRDFVWEVSETEQVQARTVTICAKDRPGLFSKISGVFTLNGLDILKADIFTWKNNIALDIFTVRPPKDLIYEKDQWDKMAGHLTAAMSGELDLAAALPADEPECRAEQHYATRPHRITIDNHTSSFFTIVEVITYDFPGLLFHITDALYRQKLDVRIAKIATKIDQVVDVFYVRDLYSEKIEDAEQTEALRAAIEEVLPCPQEALAS